MSRKDRAKKSRLRQKQMATQKALETMVVWKHLLPLFTPDEIVAAYALFPWAMGTDGIVPLDLVKETRLKVDRAFQRVMPTAMPEMRKSLGWPEPEEGKNGG